MPQIYTEIIIDAPVAHVWEKLVDFKHYDTWHPVFKRIELNVPLAVGANAHLCMKAKPEKKEKLFKVAFTEVEVNKVLVWIGA